MERQTGPFTDDRLGQSRALTDHLQVGLRVGEALPDTIQLTEDTFLHLLSGLVGEGHCEDMTVTLRVLHQQTDIFRSKGERLATAC